MNGLNSQSHSYRKRLLEQQIAAQQGGAQLATVNRSPFQLQQPPSNGNNVSVSGLNVISNTRSAQQVIPFRSTASVQFGGQVQPGGVQPGGVQPGGDPLLAFRQQMANHNLNKPSPPTSLGIGTRMDLLS